MSGLFGDKDDGVDRIDASGGRVLPIKGETEVFEVMALDLAFEFCDEFFGG